MQQPIITFETDEHDDWVAILQCNHRQHVRHNPPWFNRPWVITVEGRQAHIGYFLSCKHCERG